MLKSFIGPLALTLAIALFVLLMQFIYIYIDDIVGKGLGLYIIIKLLGMVTLTLMPMGLPLAILLASIMTFGNLAENNELASMKAAGLSLPKIMSPLIVLIFVISIGAFFFANNVLPWVMLKKDSVLFDIRSAKPALNIQQEVFYNGIDNYSIYIGKKDQDQQTIHDVMIYDHSSDLGNTKMVKARDGKMKMSSDQHYLILELYHGNTYQELIENETQHATHPFMVNNFKQQTLYFDLSGFRFMRTSEDAYKNSPQSQMLNIKQLTYVADSMTKLQAKNKNQFYTDFSRNFYSSTRYNALKLRPISQAADGAKASAIDNAIQTVRNAMAQVKVRDDDQTSTNDQILRMRTEWHKKFTFAISCLMLFFIGAPLGAIIKKGGLGLPVVMSLILFIVYYIVTIICQKSAMEEALTVTTGMWLPIAVFMPLGVFLTYKAANDSALFDRDAYINLWNKVKKLFGGKTAKA